MHNNYAIRKFYTYRYLKELLRGCVIITKIIFRINHIGEQFMGSLKVTLQYIF